MIQWTASNNSNCV